MTFFRPEKLTRTRPCKIKNKGRFLFLTFNPKDFDRENFRSKLIFIPKTSQ